MPDQYGNYNGMAGLPGALPAPYLPETNQVPLLGGAVLSGQAAGQNMAAQRIALARNKLQYQQEQDVQNKSGLFSAHSGNMGSNDNPVTGDGTPPAPPVHPGVLSAITSGISHLFGMGGGAGAIPNPGTPPPAAAPPVGYSQGGTVVGRPDVNAGSTGRTFEPRLARAHGGRMPAWAGAVRSAPGGDGGSWVAPGDQAHPPGDSAAASQILAMDAGGAVGGTVPMTNVVGVPTPNSPNIPMTMDSGGPVPYSPPSLLPQTNGVPGPGGAVLSGQAAGQNMAANSIAQKQSAIQFTQTHDMRKDMASAVEQFADHLDQGSLDDAGKPKGSHGISPPSDAPTAGAPAAPVAAPPAGAAAAAGAPPASPVPAPPGAPAAPGAAPADAPTPGDKASVAAVATAAADPAAQAGIPQKSPEESSKPAHSLDHEWWDKSDDLMRDAVAAGARAGQDPQKVMESLMAVRNGFLQSHILRNLSAAEVARQNGDWDGVEKGLRNAYYYFPDGKDLTVKRDPSTGQVMYQSPTQPQIQKIGDDGKPVFDANHSPVMVPNMIPVDATHIKLTAEAVMDPTKVADTLAGYRQAASDQAYKANEGDAKILAARAGMASADARKYVGLVRMQLVPSQIGRNAAEATMFNARAQALVAKAASEGGLKPADALKLAQAGAKAASDLIQGLNTTTPTTEPQLDRNGKPVLGPDGKPIMITSNAPAAGRTARSTPVPGLANLTPAQKAEVIGRTSQLMVANAGKLDGATATLIAAHIVSGRGGSHPYIGADGKPGVDPKTKSRTADNVHISADRKTAWVWNPQTRQYDKVGMNPSMGHSLANGEGDFRDDGMGGGSNEPDPDAADDAAQDARDNEPAVEP